MLHQRADTAVRLAGVEASRAFFAPCLEGPGKMATWVAHVDAETRCIHLERYERADAEALPIRNIVRDAAAYGAVGLVLAEHAGGARAALVAVRQATRRLAEAAEAIDVTLLDHLIFSGSRCTSMRRAGLL